MEQEKNDFSSLERMLHAISRVQETFSKDVNLNDVNIMNSDKMIDEENIPSDSDTQDELVTKAVEAFLKNQFGS